MLGKLGFLGVLAILASATGCTMCCHPYDNCGPVFDESSGRGYCSNVRAGSILEERAVSVDPADSEEIIAESPQGVSSTMQRLPMAESEPRMLSTTDRKVGETAAVSKTHTSSRTIKQTGEYVNPKVRRW
ncbi:MAG: hypothetical protein IT426_09880 [Pirellulales bacterium]|nr:hypothetical protein [Pirellulales bacterium]